MAYIYPSIIIFGFYLFINDYFVLVKSKVKKSVSKNKLETKSVIYIKLEELISKYVHLSDEQIYDYSKDFSLIKLTKEPKQYFVEILAKGFLYFCTFTLIALILRNVLVFGIAIAIPLLFVNSERKTLKNKVSQAKVNIEKDLPKFCSVICSKLAHTQNVSNIIKAFYPIADDDLSSQLDITLADIESSVGVENALILFQNRVHSAQLTDVIRGLISVHNGNDQRNYFAIKSEEFNQKYENLVKMEVSKRPQKILPMQIAIGLFFMMLLLYPMAIYFTQISFTN